MKWIKRDPGFFNVFFGRKTQDTANKLMGLSFEQEGFRFISTFLGGDLFVIQIYGHFGGDFARKKRVGFYIFHEGLEEETSLCRVKLRGVQESPGPQILRLELKTNRN